MIDHDTIEAAIRTGFAGNGEAGTVTLIARYRNDDLQLPSTRGHLFIPDFHLLHPDDARRFPNYHFRLEDDAERFFAVLRVLKAQAGDELQVWHLGDLFDTWRALGNRGDQIEVDEMAAFYDRPLGLLRNPPPAGAGAAFFAGNHDYSLLNMPEWRARRFALLKSPVGEGDVLIVHGDIFSAVEKLPIELRKFGVQVSRRFVKSGSAELEFERRIIKLANIDLPHGDAPIGGENMIGHADDARDNVTDADQLPVASVHHIFFKGARSVAQALEADGYDIRAVIIGHTHEARMIIGERQTGVPLLLMDCGAWFGRCRVTRQSPWIWSAQTGVMIGNEFRLYQIGQRSANV